MMPQDDFVAWFRSASPYIHAHRGRTVVVCFGGEIAQWGGLESLCHDLALLNALGLRLIVVYGIRPQIEARLARAGIEARLVDGIRVTDSEALSAVADAAGAMTLELGAKLSMGLANSPMAGARIRAASGNFVFARPYGIRKGVDFQFTGEVRRVDHEAIRSRLERGEIVLIPPIGYSPTGELFNMFAHQVAADVAVSVGADKLVFFGEDEGLRDLDGRLLRQLTADEADQLLAANGGGVELQHALRACRLGVERCHLIGGQAEGALLQELFSRDGVGTLISNLPFDNIRAAGIQDIGGILELIQPLEDQGYLVRRSREKLEAEIDRFTVLDRDGAVIGCAALYPLADSKMTELACLAVHPDYRKGRIGAALLKTLENDALAAGAASMIVLTTHTDHWFREHGFETAGIDALPGEKQALYNYQRNARVLIKPLS